MLPIRMFRAAENGTSHPEQRAPIGRTRMIRAALYQSGRHRFSDCPRSSETPRLSCEPASRVCYRRSPRTPMPMDNALQLVESFLGRNRIRHTGTPSRSSWPVVMLFKRLDGTQQFLNLFLRIVAHLSTQWI